MAGEWTPWFAWSMDLLKSLLTLGVTALVTVLIVNRLQERATKQRSRADALFQLQMDSLREFRRAAATYEVAAISAYTDIYQWKGGDKTVGMQRYEGIAYGDFEAALAGLAQRFNGSARVTQAVASLRATHERRHKLYDDLVDVQLDRTSNLDLWSRADQQRRDFNTLLSDARQLGQDILVAAETDILLVR